MRTTIICCDRCGAEISLAPVQSIHLGRGINYDLCLKCYDGIDEKLTAIKNEILWYPITEDDVAFFEKIIDEEE